MLGKDLKINRDTSRNPLFDVMFIYQNNGYPEINFKDAKIEYFFNTSKNLQPKRNEDGSVDYKELNDKIKPLKDLMEKTDKVRILGPNTDITFSIKGMTSVPCCGTANIPDGELYTAPIKESVNGVITYNTSSTYNGEVFKNIKLEIEDGKIKFQIRKFYLLKDTFFTKQS